jgi:hypothetical protein
MQNKLIKMSTTDNTALPLASTAILLVLPSLQLNSRVFEERRG